MASMKQIQTLMAAWVDVPTLTPMQRNLIQSMKEVADKSNMQEFQIFIGLMCGQFFSEIYPAILKGRAEGLGAQEPDIHSDVSNNGSDTQ